MRRTEDYRRTYCAVCDREYRRGEYAAHRADYPHTASLAARRSMAAWYRGNARALAERIAREGGKV